MKQQIRILLEGCHQLVLVEVSADKIKMLVSGWGRFERHQPERMFLLQVVRRNAVCFSLVRAINTPVGTFFPERIRSQLASIG